MCSGVSSQAEGFPASQGSRGSGENRVVLMTWCALSCPMCKAMALCPWVSTRPFVLLQQAAVCQESPSGALHSCREVCVEPFLSPLSTALAVGASAVFANRGMVPRGMPRASDWGLRTEGDAGDQLELRLAITGLG